MSSEDWLGFWLFMMSSLGAYAVAYLVMRMSRRIRAWTMYMANRWYGMMYGVGLTWLVAAVALAFAGFLYWRNERHVHSPRYETALAFHGISVISMAAWAVFYSWTNGLKFSTPTARMPNTMGLWLSAFTHVLFVCSTLIGAIISGIDAGKHDPALIGSAVLYSVVSLWGIVSMVFSFTVATNLGDLVRTKLRAKLRKGGGFQEV